MAVSEQRIQDLKENRVIPLAALYPHNRNYKSHPPEQIRKIKASLERWGQVRSIVIKDDGNGSYTIVAGHGVVEAAQQLKMSDLRADVFPQWVPDEEILGYLVADNELGNDAVDDTELLASLLQEQQDAGYDLASMGSDEETLRQMLESLGDEYVGDGETQEEEESGSLLSLLDITIADPRHVVSSGDIWKMGKHTLVIAHVFKDWHIWTQYLKDESCLFLPFPGPMVALSDKAEEYTLVLVQPDAYIGGHVLDRYADIHGEKSVKKIEHVQVSVLREDEAEVEEDMENE